jgi:Ca-activated chloride channel family protein
MHLHNKAVAALVLFAAAAPVQRSLAQSPVAPNPVTQKDVTQPAPADAAGDDEVAVFRAGTQLVDLAVSVLDKNGKPISGIPRSAFQVYENNILQPIKVFRAEDAPVSIGIVIDNSGSMRDKRARVAAAALSLVKLSNPQDEEFIVDFNDDTYLDQPFTSDIKKLETTLALIKPEGGTAMRDAISLSIDYMKEAATRERKVLLVVTDGNDNASTVGLERLVNRARQSEVLIYAIGLLDEEERREAKAAKRALNALTQESGGLAFYPKGVTEVDAIALQVAHEIRNQYTIAYSPLNDARDGSFRQIKVTVNGPGHPQVRTRTGYYATADRDSKKAGSSTP